MMLDLRILNGTVVSDGKVGPLDIGIEGGQIAAVEPTGGLGPARKEIDATDVHVMPGAIDVHFHCRAPGNEHRGDFGSETRAAAAGGVTTVFEMPISDPACSTPEVFRARRALAEAQAQVNFSLYSGAALSRHEAAEMAELGAVGFKLFTKAPPPGREREFAGLWAADEGAMLDALDAVAATGSLCVIHAEHDGLLRHFDARADGDGTPGRPPVIEAVAIASIAALAAATGTRVHIAHVSSRAALAAVRAGHSLHAALSSETCPQYLALDSSAVAQYGGAAKIGPPLREPADRAALWHALAEGTITLVASDHSPFLLAEKVGGDFASAPLGLPTVELLVPVMLDAAARGELPLASAVGLVTSAPARLFGLSGKGTIAEGADADLALASLSAHYRPSPRTLISRAADCGIVFEHMDLLGRVETTIVGGEIVYRDRRIASDPAGQFVPGGMTLEQV